MLLCEYVSRVFKEVTFWNSAEYGILCGSDFTSTELRGILHCLIPWNFIVIPRNSMLFQ
jgi:hypothetical protein